MAGDQDTRGNKKAKWMEKTKKKSLHARKRIPKFIANIENL